MPTITIQQAILIASRYQAISRKEILKFIPYQPGCNPTNAFKILLTIYTHPKLPAGGIKKLHNSFSYVVDNNLSHLLQCGLISPVNKPYWISQINAWRVDKGYVVTKAGENALFKLFEGVYEGNTEIDHKQAS